MSDSHTLIDRLVEDFFDSFDNRNGRVPDYDRFKDCFLPDAVIGNRSEAGIAMWSVADFWAPRNELLTNGRLVDFHEWETGADTSIEMGIASRQSSYEKAGLLDDLPYTGEGIKMFQFAMTENGWRIASLFWEDRNES